MTKKKIVLQQHHWKQSDLDLIRNLMDRGSWEQAEQALRAYLNDNPEDFRAQFLLGRMYLTGDRYAEARICYEHLGARFPGRTDIELNLAKAHDMLLEWDKSGELYGRVLEREPDNLKAILGLSTIAVQLHDPQRALELADRALALDPNATQALSNKSFAYLQNRNYAEGWKYYEYGAGHLKWRTVFAYHEPQEPRWKGEKGKEVKLIVHTEQGIGDQIAGIEPLREAIRDVDVVALDADPKMRGIFRRSFPEIPIHGRENITAAIAHDDLKATHTCGIFSLHTQYRHSEEDYPKKPYLVADPCRRAMYRGWLDSLGDGLKIGLCLSGGHTLTHKAARNLPLDALMPIFRQGHVFVSLEYQDRTEDFEDFEARKGITVHQNPHILANLDFDDPAALIAELDVVIGVPTAAIHACGALGTTAFCLVHETPNIHYCNSGELMAYYGSVHMIRRKVSDRWVESVDEVVKRIEQMVNVRAAA